MSKINIEFDTVAKTFTISKDGQAIPNVCWVNIFKGYDEGQYSISIESEEKSKEDKTYTRTIVYATDQAKTEFEAAVAARYGV